VKRVYVPLNSVAVTDKQTRLPVGGEWKGMRGSNKDAKRHVPLGQSWW
jgi:hypothetical protein